MKKSLLALAVLGAFAGAASAQTNVTLYGVVDMGFNTSETDTNNVATTDVRGLDSIMSGSRIGFRGTEDLGGGLKANFLLEYAIYPDEQNPANANNIMSNRQSFVGLSGNFGAVNLGRQYTLIHGVQGMVDPGGNANAAGWIGSATSTVRQSNAIAYTSPNFGGFSASVMKGFGEANAVGGAARTNEQWSVRGDYKGGPLAVAVAYENISDVTGAAAALGTNGITVAIAGVDDRTNLSLGATYDFGMAKVGYLYTRASLDATAAGVADVDWTNHNIGVTVPFGAVTAFASYGVGELEQVGEVGEADGWQIGALYALSKRTNLYAIAGQVDANDTPRTTTVDRQTFALGVRHTF